MLFVTEVARGREGFDRIVSEGKCVDMRGMGVWNLRVSANCREFFWK